MADIGVQEMTIRAAESLEHSLNRRVEHGMEKTAGATTKMTGKALQIVAIRIRDGAVNTVKRLTGDLGGMSRKEFNAIKKAKCFIDMTPEQAQEAAKQLKKYNIRFRLEEQMDNSKLSYRLLYLSEDVQYVNEAYDKAVQNTATISEETHEEEQETQEEAPTKDEKASEFRRNDFTEEAARETERRVPSAEDFFNMPESGELTKEEKQLESEIKKELDKIEDPKSKKQMDYGTQWSGEGKNKVFLIAFFAGFAKAVQKGIVAAASRVSVDLGKGSLQMDLQKNQKVIEELDKDRKVEREKHMEKGAR